MILRRFTASLRRQDWTAVAVELVVVVLGVFIGVQASNWNQARADRAREHVLLQELRGEIAESMQQTQIKLRAFEQVGTSGQQAVAFLDAGKSCGDQCWPVLVDFFHASQWQLPEVRLPTYEEMRRNGWPRQREIVNAVEDYLRQSTQVNAPLRQPPAHRSLVRGLIPLAAHAPYWKNCFRLANGEETYVEPCPAGVSPQLAASAVAAIAANPDIHRTLTEWTGFMSGYVTSLEGQNQAARQALAVIDAELAQESESQGSPKQD